MVTKKSKQKDKEHYSYLILLLNDRGRVKYTKVGYTCDLNRRFDELEYQYDAKVDIICFWKFNRKEIGLDHENHMRMRLQDIKGSHYIRQDRFQRIKKEQIDLNDFNREAIALAEKYA